MSTEATNNHLERNLTVLFSTSIIPVIIVLWVGYEYAKFDPIPWLTLIIGSIFGLSIAIIVNTKSEQILKQLKKSEEDKTTFAKFILISNFQQLRRIVEIYFETINDSTPSTTEKKTLLKTILPSIISFLNLSETTLPNVGYQLTQANITEINSRFIMLHKLIILLESGSDTKFEENLPNLNTYTENTLNYLNEL